MDTDFIYKKAANSDISEIKVLWEEVFGDSGDYIAHFIAHFGIENCYVCEINHKITAIAFSLPTVLSPSKFEGVPAGRGSLLPLKYVYACATHPQHRQQGIMKILLTAIYDDACHENAAGIFLHAADQFLADYYRKLGFEDFFYRNHFWYYKDKLLAEELVPSGAIHFISPETYHKKRVEKLENTCFVNWSEDFFRFINENKTQLCEYENSIFSYRTEFNQIIVDEFLGDIRNEQLARLLIEHIPDVETVHIRLQGFENCCGQIKWCTHSENQPSSGYFALAME